MNGEMLLASVLSIVLKAEAPLSVVAIHHRLTVERGEEGSRDQVEWAVNHLWHEKKIRPAGQVNCWLGPAKSVTPRQ